MTSNKRGSKGERQAKEDFTCDGDFFHHLSEEGGKRRTKGEVEKRGGK